MKSLSLLSAILVLFVVYTIYNGRNLKMQTMSAHNIEVIIYSKASCPYCQRAKKLFDNNLITYREVDITLENERHQRLITDTRQVTVPYIYINGEFIGGFTELKAFANSHKWHKLFGGSY